jgi:hypothetical protein
MRRTCRYTLGILIVFLSGCSGVQYHEKQELGRRIMQFDANELETSFQNKIIYAREVSGGRPGHAAGGGCGCGN